MNHTFSATLYILISHVSIHCRQNYVELPYIYSLSILSFIQDEFVSCVLRLVNGWTCILLIQQLQMQQIKLNVRITDMPITRIRITRTIHVFTWHTSVWIGVLPFNSLHCSNGDCTCSPELVVLRQTLKLYPDSLQGSPACETPILVAIPVVLLTIVSQEDYW